MTSNSLLIILAVLVLSLSKGFKVSAQEWEKLVPLVSTCEDVKKLLGEKECKPPFTIYKFPKYRLVIDISERDNYWKVPAGRVTKVYVSLIYLIKLEDYKGDLSGFKEFPDNDAPGGSTYENEVRGIRLSVASLDSGKWIQEIVLIPPKPKNCKN